MFNRLLATVACCIVSMMCSVSARSAVPARECDVVVYGATPGGITAAVAAAREGASVLLLEPGNHVGGMVSGGLGATDIGNSKTVGGITREYFGRIGKAYGSTGPAWKHEPHVAEQVFNDLLRDAGVKVELNQRLREHGGVTAQGGRITSITTESGNVYAGEIFIDAGYEGDLMAQAGVTYAIGREGRDQYGETRAGVRKVVPFGAPGSAYDEAGLLPDIHSNDAGVEGQADRKIMAYTFRLCMTRDPANRRAFIKPENYDPRRYATLLFMFRQKPNAVLEDCMRLNELPNGKTDTNNKASIICSTNLHNGSWEYPEASYARRQEIWKNHEQYVRGLLYFLSHDPRVPEKLRAEANEWGLAKDEFKDNGNWPYQLYVRVARRMIGEHVMTENDLLTLKKQPDSIAMGSYMMDSHRVQRLVMANGDIATEGGVGGGSGPYEIAYRSIVPKRRECANLLVPVCMSASNVAWCSIRMEPVFMMMGHSAGVAAAMAVKEKVAVQAVAYPVLREKLLQQNQVLSYTPPATKPVSAAAAPALPLIGMKGQPADVAGIKNFFPCFDKYGQYVHRDWPDKTRADADLAAKREAEAKDMATHAGPVDWNRFGGWAAGPKLRATGFFRTEKYQGKWWLVDPDGRLFFSHGVDCVRKYDPTPIEERENFFAELPTSDPAFSAFFIDVKAVKAHYGGRSPKSFLFSWANLMRKYGPDWDRASGEIAQKRLRSWGFNTIGNWSHEPTYLLRQTPYTVNLGCTSRNLAGAPRTFRDPFDPQFAALLAERVKEEAGKSLDDPWCLGYFVDNELPWGKEESLGEWTLRSPADQPAKIAMVEGLKSKYASIEKLNEAWRASYASWDALLASREAPGEKAIEDQKAFHARYADVYFKTIRDVLKQNAPNQLYLGCRFHTNNIPARDAATKYCDIVSYNVYRKGVDTWPEDRADVPVMITEYSFGAVDLGMFYGGMMELKTQADRVAAFEAFVQSVQRRPALVGCHWFQYQDQPASGRTLEGENGQYGLVDIADTPYAEMVSAARSVGARLYETRAGRNATAGQAGTGRERSVGGRS